MAKKKKIEKKQVNRDSKKSVKKKESSKSNNERQGTIVIGVMVGLVLLLILVFVMQAGASKFKYHGIDFKKTKYGEVQLYTASIPIRDYSGNIVKTIELDFRNDPRDLEYINVDIDDIIFNNRLALLSVDDAEKCEDNGIALINLGGIFLKQAGIAAKIVYFNETRANEEGVPYVTCDNTFNNTVLEIKEGPTTAITQTRNNCYELTYNNCEIMMVTEKFQLELLEQDVSSVK